MRLSLVIWGALLLSATSAAIDVVEIVRLTPACAQPCSLNALAKANCSLENIRECICYNSTILLDISTCVMKSCDLDSQYTTSTLLQNKICNGVPKQSRTREVFICTVVVSALAYPIIALRFVSRWMVARKFWWDDLSVFLTTLGLIGMTIVVIWNSERGFGIHFWDVPVIYVKGLRIRHYIAQWFYVIGSVGSKMAMLLLYLRIFISKRFQLILKFSILGLSCHFIAYTLSIFLQCLPVRALWTLEPAKCVNSSAIIYSGAVICILEDVYIMFLPIPELMKLKLSTQKKVGLGLMMAIGSFACLTSIIRLRFISKFGNSVDLTFDNVDVAIWSVIEIFTATICASLVCFRPLMQRLFPRQLATHASTMHSSPGTPNVFSKVFSSRARNDEGAFKLTSSAISQGGSRWTDSYGIRSHEKQARGVTEPRSSGEEILRSTHEESDGKVWVTQSTRVETEKINRSEIGSSKLFEHKTTIQRGSIHIDNREGELDGLRMQGLNSPPPPMPNDTVSSRDVKPLTQPKLKRESSFPISRFAR